MEYTRIDNKGKCMRMTTKYKSKCVTSFRLAEKKNNYKV